MITVRPARRDDAHALAELAARTFPLACPPHTTAAAKESFITQNLSPASFDAYLADENRDLVVALEDGGRLVAYTMSVAGEPDDPDVASAVSARPAMMLSKCYADPAVHGSGAASAALDATLVAAVARGAAAMWLGVHEDNARAQRFYAKHGFTRVGSRRFLVGDRYEDDWVMAVPLR